MAYIDENTPLNHTEKDTVIRTHISKSNFIFHADLCVVSWPASTHTAYV